MSPYQLPSYYIAPIGDNNTLMRSYTPGKLIVKIEPLTKPDSNDFDIDQILRDEQLYTNSFNRIIRNVESANIDWVVATNLEKKLPVGLLPSKVGLDEQLSTLKNGIIDPNLSYILKENIDNLDKFKVAPTLIEPFLSARTFIKQATEPYINNSENFKNNINKAIEITKDIDMPLYITDTHQEQLSQLLSDSFKGKDRVEQLRSIVDIYFNLRNSHDSLVIAQVSNNLLPARVGFYDNRLTGFLPRINLDEYHLQTISTNNGSYAIGSASIQKVIEEETLSPIDRAVNEALLGAEGELHTATDTFKISVLPDFYLIGVEANVHGGGPGSIPFPINKSLYMSLLPKVEHGARKKDQHVIVYILDTLLPKDWDNKGEKHPAMKNEATRGWWRQYVASEPNGQINTENWKRIDEIFKDYSGLIKYVADPSDSNYSEKVFKRYGIKVEQDDTVADITSKLTIRLLEKLLNEFKIEAQSIPNNIRENVQELQKYYWRKNFVQEFKQAKLFGDSQSYHLYNHSIFIANIINHRAPEAKLVFVEMLNEYASGHIQASLAVLEWLKKDIKTRISEGYHCIINCSFTFPLRAIPKNQNIKLTEDPNINDDNPEKNFIRDVSAIMYDFLSFSSKEDNDNIDPAKVVVIAASGNDSFKGFNLFPNNQNNTNDNTNQPSRFDPSIPAALPMVIGVGALKEPLQQTVHEAEDRSHFDALLADYSNVADLTWSAKLDQQAHTYFRPYVIGEEVGFYAVGGQIILEPIESSEDLLLKVHGGVSGPYLGEKTPYEKAITESEAGEDKYALWSGTSFAAAEVTGMLASILLSDDIEDSNEPLHIVARRKLEALADFEASTNNDKYITYIQPTDVLNHRA